MYVKAEVMKWLVLLYTFVTSLLSFVCLYCYLNSCRVLLYSIDVVRVLKVNDIGLYSYVLDHLLWNNSSLLIS